MRDFFHPDRIVLGSRNCEAAREVAELYDSIDAPIVITDVRTAEMIKYASNAFLATKISFINEVAEICDAVGADATQVADGMGLDPRIGAQFLKHGLGFGGSCLPKDVRALAYMGLRAGQPIEEISVDRVFIGSCTNSRIEDLRAAAEIVRGQTVDSRVTALVVPGSAQVRRQAETEGLDQVFLDAGFEWRLAGCSMCLGMNPDVLAPGERCASTSNRNFEGRQGRGGRTHLVSPQMAAAAALHGHFVDVRALAAEPVAS